MYLILIPLILPVLYWIVNLLYVTFVFRSLLSVPGPFWTRLTRLWYFDRVRRGDFEKDNIRLHQRYGPVVRIAPDHYSISDRAAVRAVYGTGSKFAKSAWYEGWKHPDPDKWTLFPDRNVRRHDHCTNLFSQRLTEFAERGQSFNLGYWLQCYAFDVIGEITFGQRFGFLDRGHDIEGTIGALQRLMTYSTLVGVYPQWHPRLFGPLSRFSWSGAGGRAYIMRYVEQRIRQHKDCPKWDVENDTLQTQDFLEKMAIARDKDPEKVTDYHLFMMGLSNVIAGSDTTAISLASIMYHLLQYPPVLEKLRREIDDFTAQGLCSARVTFKESQRMPYFQAVIKEALRMHSATGLPLWREVPAGGAEINGYFFPQGAVVGVNTWVAHYDEAVFPDATTFRPERWIETESDPEKLKVMNDMYMPVSFAIITLHPLPVLGMALTRSSLASGHLIPGIVRDFDFCIKNGTWTTKNIWFVKPTDFEVSVTRRSHTST
ncbi:hypothetical protein EYZ11_004965 [Aspergillus tanneri]|uniref:Cytochrome P450 n=1 Tax=Aspergillus tanneri TaxID=1220188 RepID=A0A4S3JJP6_9EURO|nr:hypothetical protein EYZ11_004965 [Aspergillus tanneri]